MRFWQPYENDHVPFLWGVVLCPLGLLLGFLGC